MRKPSRENLLLDQQLVLDLQDATKPALFEQLGPIKRLQFYRHLIGGLMALKKGETGVIEASHQFVNAVDQDCFPINIYGKENYLQSSVAVCSHQKSSLETFIVPGLEHRNDISINKILGQVAALSPKQQMEFTILLKETLVKEPELDSFIQQCFPWLFTLLPGALSKSRHIPVKRFLNDKALSRRKRKQQREDEHHRVGSMVQTLLNDDEKVVFFPEGTRSKNGTISKRLITIFFEYIAAAYRTKQEEGKIIKPDDFSVSTVHSHWTMPGGPSRPDNMTSRPVVFETEPHDLSSTLERIKHGQSDQEVGEFLSGEVRHHMAQMLVYRWLQEPSFATNGSAELEDRAHRFLAV